MPKPKNRLHDLEQTLKPAAPQAPSAAPAQLAQPEASDQNQPIEGRATGQWGAIETRVFDHNEPIELRYSQATDGYVPSTPIYAAAQSVMSDLDASSGAFEVEAFEVNADTPPPPPPKVAEQKTERSPSAPLQPEVVANPSPSLPLKSAAPEAQSFSLETAEPKPATSPEVATKDDFLKDLQAIVEGKKTYDGTNKQVVDVSHSATQFSTPEPSTSPGSAAAPPTPGDPAKQTSPHDVFDRLAQGLPPQPAPAASPTPTYSDAHSVFDRMGKSMAYANSFDLGTITLEQRFDEFDRLLDVEEKDSQLLSSTQFRNASNISNSQSDLQSDSLGYQQPNQISSAFVRQENILEEKHPDEKYEGTLNPEWDKTYDYAFVGRGSSIAYYINALGDALPTNSIVVGEQDPWQPSKHEKSRGPGYINHQLQLIAQWGDKVPEYSLQYLYRLSFSEQNAKIINRVMNRVESGVNKIKLIANPKYKEGLEEPEKLFEITPKGFNPYKAKKVIVGMGAGPHKDIDNEDVQKTIDTQWFKGKDKGEEYRNKHIFDMDKFMRTVIDADKPEDGKGKEIIVHGANAGIDPVEAASKSKYKVTWLIRDTLPPFLEGQLLEYAPSIKPIKVSKDIKVVIVKGDAKPLKVTFTEEGKPEKTTIEVDYYVLALGQDIYAPGAAGAVIDENILKDLEPIYDINQVYSDKPYETVLGLQTPGNTKAVGLEIIGAAAFSLGGKVKHNYVKRKAENLKNYIRDSFKEQKKKPKGFEHIDNIEKWLDGFLKSPEAKELLPVEELRSSLSQKLEDGSISKEEQQKWEAVIAMSQDLAEAQDYLAKKPLEKGKNVLTVKDEIMNQVKYEAANVIISPQLTAVRASVGALVSVRPRYLQIQDEEIRKIFDHRPIEGGKAQPFTDAEKDRTEKYFKDWKLKVNFSGDSRTMLMVYAIQKYPNIDGEDAEYIVGEIIKHRNSHKEKDDEEVRGFHPLGYDEFWEQHWDIQFELANESSLFPDERAALERRTYWMKFSEEKGREKWKLVNESIQNWVAIGGELTDVEKLRQHLLSLDRDMQSLLRNVYGEKKQQTWDYRRTEKVDDPFKPGRKKVLYFPMVKIVLEGILTPEQGQTVYEFLSQILNLKPPHTPSMGAPPVA